MIKSSAHTLLKYVPPGVSVVCSSRDSPKSATLQTMFSSTSIFRAAMSWKRECRLDIYIYIYIYRLSYERRGDISFIARETISKYDIVTRAIKLILPSLEYDNLFITYLCLYLDQKPNYIFKLFTLRVHFKIYSK